MSNTDRLSRKAALAGIGTGLALPILDISPGRGADAGTVRIANSPIEASSVIFAAQSQGFLSKAGITADIEQFANGNAATAALLSGSLDVAGSNVLSLATAHEKGLPLKILASGSIYTTQNPTTLLLVPSSSPLRAAKELNGKTVAVNVLQGVAHVSAQSWIDKNGGDAKSVKFIELPFASMPPALGASRVDAAVVAEPQLTQLHGETRILGKSYDGIGDLWLTNVWVATDAWIAANPALARNFSAAMQQAAIWANRNRDKMAQIISGTTKIDLATVRAMRRSTFVEHVIPNLVQPVIDVGARYGVLNARFSASDLFYPGALT